jgi:hypothetical protein
MPTKNATTKPKGNGTPTTSKGKEPGEGRPNPHAVRDAADALYRSARESCHQHERLKRLLEHGADDLEFQGVCGVAALCDELLSDHTKRYELAAVAGRGKEPEDWWHNANALWMASREYGRRHAASDAAGARFKRHGSAQFGEIALDYELEMSARMALKTAIVNYGHLRPDAGC